MPDDPTATADPGVDTDTDTATAADDSTPASTPAAAPDTPAQAPPTTAAPGPGAPPAAAPPPQADQTPVATLQPAPNIVRPKRGGLAGVMDEIADDLAGPGSVHTDADGNEYINRKGQWLKIAGEALRGAAAGAAVAQGPGGAWRGAAAGIKAGDEQAQREQQAQQQQTQEARQAKQDQFNAVMQKHNLAAKEFELQRMGVKANQDDIKFAQEQNDREEKLGSADLGMVKDEADLADQMSKQQGFWKDVHRNEINAVPEYGSDGQRLGLHVWKRIPGIGDQQTDPGTPIRIWDAGNKKMTEQVPTVPLTHNQVDAYNHTADNLQRQSQIDDNAEAYKAQQTATSEAEEESHRATTRKSNAETKKIQGETAAQGQTAAGAAKPDAFGVTSALPEKEYTKRYDAFGKAYVQPLTKSDQQLAQFSKIQSDIDKTGNMTGAESVVGLFNAIGISASPLKGMGFRINSNTVEEHENARGLGQSLYQKLLSLKSGDVVTPQQLKDYASLATSARESQYISAIDEARRQNLPVDFLPRGNGGHLDTSTARMYMRAAGNDPAKARAAAQQAGWQP
jgi:hypothetical protein